MAKNNHHDLSRLPTFDPKDKDLVNVIIETPRGSRNKFAYDEKLGIIRLKKVLPPGMDFPYDFGFIPSTKASDGDPLDALLLMDEPAHPGTLMRYRLIASSKASRRKAKTPSATIAFSPSANIRSSTPP
jgi:inorganic pyrophosphatase